MKLKIERSEITYIYIKKKYIYYLIVNYMTKKEYQIVLKKRKRYDYIVLDKTGKWNKILQTNHKTPKKLTLNTLVKRQLSVMKKTICYYNFIETCI